MRDLRDLRELMPQCLISLESLISLNSLPPYSSTKYSAISCAVSVRASLWVRS